MSCQCGCGRTLHLFGDFTQPPFDPVKPPPTHPTCVEKPHEFHPFDFICVHCGADLDDDTVDQDCPELK